MARGVNFGQALADALGIKVSKRKVASFNKAARGAHAAIKKRSGGGKRSRKGGGS